VGWCSPILAGPERALVLFSHQGRGSRSSRKVSHAVTGARTTGRRVGTETGSERDIDSRPEAAGVDALGLDK
jgi:hypothetical protein